MQLKPLDPRFAKLIALMQSSTHEGERAAARARAEPVLAPSGVPFERALAQLAYQKVRAENPNNPLAGFDEYQEIQEPGFMARKATERAERRRIWLERRKAVVARHGSAEAVLEPCERENLLLAAVKPWRRTQNPPWERWTESLDGRSSSYDYASMSADVLQAVATAYPLPTTFRGAKAEADYWRDRNDDMEHAQSEDGGAGDFALDLVALLRWHMVRDLAERDLPIDNLPDLVERFRMYRAAEVDDASTEDALLRDLEAIAEAQAGGAQ